MNKPTLLAVDLSNQLYRACAANATLSSGRTFTGGLYGFIMQVQKAIAITEADSIVLCRDTKPYKRSETYPEYKALRANTKDPDLVERVAQTVPLINQLAEVLGWPIWAIQGFESDDLIAYCMSQHRHRFSRIVAMSNDSDLFQFYRWPQFAVYRGGKKGLQDRVDYDRDWGIDPQDMPLLLSIMGTHNEVAGIEGIGPVRARALIENPRDLRKLRQQHGALIDRNLGLIQLPHPEFPKDTRIPRINKPFHQRSFLRFCSQYDIDASQATCEVFAQLRSHGCSA